MERWFHMHAEDVGVAAKGDVRLLFVGDSITEGWPESLMEQHFGSYQPANFGIGGDRTENVLWRLGNGSVGQLAPEVVSLLIGVNNFGLRGDKPKDVVFGIKTVVETLRGNFPDSHIVLHGIFPYKEKAGSPERKDVMLVNEQLSKWADRDSKVHFLDIGPQLTLPNGDISAEVMPDYLHLSPQGYQIWAEALSPAIEELLLGQ